MIKIHASSNYRMFNHSSVPSNAGGFCRVCSQRTKRLNSHINEKRMKKLTFVFLKAKLGAMHTRLDKRSIVRHDMVTMKERNE